VNRTGIVCECARENGVFASVSLWLLIRRHFWGADIDGPTCTIRLASHVVERYGFSPIEETNALTGRSRNDVSTSYDAIEERIQE
jgi:hypothetical protein